MKTTLAWPALALLALATPGRYLPSATNRAIYGTVRTHDGQLARDIGLQAYPLGVALAAVLPETRTDQNGQYRFENIPWTGRYAVYGEDDKAGYSLGRTGAGGLADPPEVVLSEEHPEGKLDLQLPEPAGFLHVRLTDKETGKPISGIEVTVSLAGPEPKFVYSMSCASNQAILLPPDKDLLLKIASWGYEEWEQSIRGGYEIRMASGSRRTLEVSLEPAKSLQKEPALPF